ncbi:MAG: hypothetical protein JXB34_09280 [Bacteroidales bacterium]|nr:hypothetical protein [Bacteroidales bacterium]
MELNTKKITADMLNAAKTVLKKHWKETKPYAEQQFKTFAQNIQLIASLKLRGEITEEKAKLHLNIQRNSIQIVLLTIEGLGLLAVEEAINAAIDVVKGTVNTAIGWNLL